MFVEHPQVALHLLGLTERACELVHEVLFLLTERVGVVAVDGRQIGVEQVLFVQMIEHGSMVHVPLGVPAHGLSFEFELDDGDRLVHLRHELCGTCQAGVVLEVLGLPYRAGVIAVGLHGEVSERQEIDTVPFFERLDVGIADRDAQDGSDESLVTRHGADPFDVVVAPLDIVVADRGEHVEDLRCA